MRILTRRTGGKIKDALAENQFGFIRGKGTRDAIGMHRTISEQNLDIDDKLCTCCVE